MPPPTPKKAKSTVPKTAQTGMMPELDAPLPGYLTPKKKTGTDDDDLTDSPVRSVNVDMPTAEEAAIGSRQEKLERDMGMAAMGKGRKSRKHKKSKKTRKTRKTKKHGKRKA